jgi:hypothetical protein
VRRPTKLPSDRARMEQAVATLSKLQQEVEALQQEMALPGRLAGDPLDVSLGEAIGESVGKLVAQEIDEPTGKRVAEAVRKAVDNAIDDPPVGPPEKRPWRWLVTPPECQ